MTQINLSHWEEAKKLIGFILNGEQKYADRLMMFLRRLVEEMEEGSKKE